MGRKFLYLALMLVLGVGGFYAYQHYKLNKMQADGEVVCDGCMTPAQEVAFRKQNSGETADGQSERKVKTSQETSTLPATSTTAATSYPAPASAANRGSYPSTVSAATLPVSDSLSPNAPDGARFGVNGGYQWYRQGNLTWRVNTQTGTSCVIYATMEEWHKAIVMQHGCGRDS